MTVDAQLDEARRSRLKSLFADAITFSGAERASFLRESTDGDDDLFREISSLLEAHDRSDSWFERFGREVISPALLAVDVEDPAGPATGSVVSHYELIDKIGGGGMGVVYKARDTRLGRLVALKFLPRHSASNPSARAQLVAEARAASRLDHSNIGVVYEIGETDDGRQFIAMGWYEGETLRTRIRRGPLDIDEAVDIALQLGSALDAAHRAGIVHRDVKPANVIVTTTGTAKLVDFGIAQLSSEEDGDRHGIAGTLAYMSPEQTAGSALDGRTDIWSIGIALYEMLAGRRPFRASDDSELIQQIRTHPAPSVVTERPDVDLHLARIVERCLEKDPGARFQTAEDFTSELRKWKTHRESVESRVPSSGRKKRVIIAASIMIIAAASFGSWAYSRNNSQTRSAAALASPFRVAVLPFTAAGSDTLRRIGDAISEDLRNELARIPSIAVPSYFSSEAYTASQKEAPAIAREMGSRYVVTGSVAGDGEGLRLRIHITDGARDRELASREYVATDGFEADAIRRVSNDMISLLDVPLSEEQRQTMKSGRFASLRAYELYLLGLHEEVAAAPRTAQGRVDRAGISNAQAFYSQARPLEPSFAQLRSRLAATHIAASVYDTTQPRREQARIEAETALRHDPALWDAHITLAKYFANAGNGQRAIEELESALKQAPNNTSIMVELAQRYRLTGRWDESMGMIDRATRLDPRDPAVNWIASTSYGRMRRFEDADRARARLLETWPNDHEVRLIRGQAHLRWRGSTDVLLAQLAKVPPDWDERGMATYGWYTAYRAARRYREGIAKLDKSKSKLSRDGIVYAPTSLMKAELYHDLGDESNARRYYALARRELSDSVTVRPEAAGVHAALALANAGLGRKRDAIAEAEKAISVSPLSKNAGEAMAYMGSAVEVFGRIGELDRAFEKIELLLTMNSGRDMSLPLLKAWPGFDPLRNDPRYAEILRKFAAR